MTLMTRYTQGKQYPATQEQPVAEVAETEPETLETLPDPAPETEPCSILGDEAHSHG